MIGQLTVHRPDSVDAVTQLLATHGDRARIHAGGTDLVVQMRSGAVASDQLIDLGRVPTIDRISFLDDGTLEIGSRVTMRDLIGDVDVRRTFPALIDGASLVGSKQIQAMATVVGNLCNASPAADSVPALHVYGAEAVLFGPSGVRHVPVAEYAVAPRRTVLGDGEWVTSIRIPPGSFQGSAYVKLGRTMGVDIAVAGVACLITDEGVRLAVSSVGPTVVRTPRTEELLARVGRFTEEAGELIAAEISPIDDVRASAWYRKAVVPVLAERSWLIATDRRTVDA